MIVLLNCGENIMKINLNTIKSILFKTINVVYLAFFLLINYLVLFTAEKTSFNCKKVFQLSNVEFLIIGLVIILSVSLVMFFIFTWLKKFTWPPLNPRINYIASFLFMLVQIYCIYQYYFHSGWDVDGIVTRADVMAISNSYSGRRTDLYLSMYPNNALLCALYARVIRIGLLFGVSELSGSIMTLIVFQCVLFFISAVLLFKIIFIQAGRMGPAVAGWLVFLSFIGISPWLSIPYSDSTGIIFPVIILYSYMVYKKSGTKRHLFLIGFFSYFGFSIKPQTVIVTIAIVICEGLRLLSLPKKSVTKCFKVLPMLILAVCCSMFMKANMVSSSGIHLDRNQQLGVTHWIMMGLNEEHQGTYAYDDVVYSTNFFNQEQRTRGNITVIKERLSNFKPGGFSEHLKKKLLNSYADGTFAWGLEGTFYLEVYPVKNDDLSVRLRDFYYQDGKTHQMFQDYSQFFWISILFGSLAAGLAAWRKKENNVLSVLMLSLIGITLFQLLFEVRARYLFCSSPLFIITAVQGWRYIADLPVRLINIIKKMTTHNAPLTSR